MDRIFILFEYTRNWPKFRRLCFSTGDFASFDIYARGEYLVVRTLNDTVLCVRGCGKFRANSREREKERENGKKTNPRTESVEIREGKASLEKRRRKEGKKMLRERERDLPCWRTVGLTVRERCKSSVRPLCRVLLRYNWKTEKENFILLNFFRRCKVGHFLDF